jgi:hypothetical protein
MLTTQDENGSGCMPEKNDIKVVWEIDPESNKTLEEVLWDMKWWFEEVIYTNRCLSDEECGIL